MLNNLGKCIGKYKKVTILTPILIILEVFLEVIIPVIMANLIDFGINASNMNYVIKTGVFLVISALMSLLFGVLAGKTASIASAGFAKNLREAMFKNVQTFSFKNLDKFSTSSVITRLTTDVTNVQNSFQMIIRMAIRAPIMIILALFVAFRINSKLALVFVSVMPILIIGMAIIIKFAHPIFTRIFAKYDKLNLVVGENLSGIRVVKSFNREKYENKKFNNISSEIYVDYKKAEQLVAFTMPLMQFTMYIAMILISWFGAKLIIGSSNNAVLGLTTGQLLSMFTYTMQILMSLMIVAMLTVMITMSKASAVRINELLIEKATIYDKEGAVKEVLSGDIEFKNVTFSYSDREDKLALKNINLKIQAGMTVGIIGGTGSSKSSLVSLIPRLYDTFSGDVFVGGVNVRDYNIKALRDEVAMVLQKNVLFSGTIKENLRWGNENATDEEIKHICDLACASEFIEKMPEKYDTYIEQGGTNVSGGQRQRLCIARALLKKPKVLILDDSTSAVDTKTDSAIRKAFEQEIPNTTKIIIAQRVSSVENADMILVMNGGCVVSSGTHKELIEKCEIYNEIYTLQKIQGGGLDE